MPGPLIVATFVNRKLDYFSYFTGSRKESRNSGEKKKR